MWNDVNKMSEDEIRAEIESLKRLRQYQSNIDVDDLLNGVNITNDLKTANLQITPGGTFFHKDRGFLPEMMDRMYNDRVIAKKKMIEAQVELEKVNKRLQELENTDNTLPVI